MYYYTSIESVTHLRMKLSRDNITVQERLLDRMDDLLQLDVAIPEMADVLSEVRMSFITLNNCIQSVVI